MDDQITTPTNTIPPVNDDPLAASLLELYNSLECAGIDQAVTDQLVQKCLSRSTDIQTTSPLYNDGTWQLHRPTTLTILHSRIC